MTSDLEEKGILGIENRTENWKTAQTFARMTDTQLSRIVDWILEPYGKSGEYRAGEVCLELFWRGFRDHLHESKNIDLHKELCLDLFKENFGTLGQQLSEFKAVDDIQISKLCDHNYGLRMDKEGIERKVKEKLFSNIRNTEIDIVISTPEHLLIGEAKHESNLRGDRRLVLVHQVIRQYVMATILLKHLNYRKVVVPFIVWDKGEIRVEKESQSLSKYRYFIRPSGKGVEGQVQFMLHKGWLKRRNILMWDTVKKLCHA